MSTSPQTLLDLGDEQFVQLTTFRRTGEAVRTPVWVARDGEALIVTTPTSSGKVKRLRHTSRVEVCRCSRRGVVPEGAPNVEAVGRLDPDPAAHEKVASAFDAKYGFEYKVAMVVERLLTLRRKTPGPKRLIIRVTPS